MPIYEFRCDGCGGRFEALVDAGTESVACRLCDAAETTRVYSAQAAPLNLVKPPGEKRRQERRNAELHSRTKAEFKARRRRARDSRGGGGG
jgi:putative FmdB family regulatory protein